MPITTLLRSLGMTTSEILSTFYQSESYKINGDSAITTFDPVKFRGIRLSKDIVSIDSCESLIKKGQRVTPLRVLFGHK